MSEITIKTPAFIQTQTGQLVPLNFNDRITLKKLNERKIQINKTSGYKIPTNSLNPVYQIAAELQKMRPNKFGAEINIEKNIPTFSGLNSQNSNATGVLIELNKMWDFNLKLSDLVEIAKKINPTIAEILKTNPKSQKPDNVVLVRPKYIRIDTEWIKEFSSKTYETTILKHFPDLKEIINKLSEIGCYKFGISGNGPMIYGFFSSKIDKKEVKKALDKKLDFIWIGKTS